MTTFNKTWCGWQGYIRLTDWMIAINQEITAQGLPLSIRQFTSFSSILFNHHHWRSQSMALYVRGNWFDFPVVSFLLVRIIMYGGEGIIQWQVETHDENQNWKPKQFERGRATNSCGKERYSEHRDAIYTQDSLFQYIDPIGNSTHSHFNTAKALCQGSELKTSLQLKSFWRSKLSWSITRDAIDEDDKTKIIKMRYNLTITSQFFPWAKSVASM